MSLRGIDMFNDDDIVLLLTTAPMTVHNFRRSERQQPACTYDNMRINYTHVIILVNDLLQVCPVKEPSTCSYKERKCAENYNK